MGVTVDWKVHSKISLTRGQIILRDRDVGGRFHLSSPPRPETPADVMLFLRHLNE